jgi:hypothetical protein
VYNTINPVHVFLDFHFQDGLLLHKFPTGYKHPNVPFYSIKWGIMGMQSGPLWLRDVCWLEYGDLMLDENGEQMGFGVVCILSFISNRFSCTYFHTTVHVVCRDLSC